MLYTEQMADEKRDTVEYTSEAFMGCEHDHTSHNTPLLQRAYIEYIYSHRASCYRLDALTELTCTACVTGEHTMLTYTRCMDSALCVPLMIDAAIFCDYLLARDAAVFLQRLKLRISLFPHSALPQAAWPRFLGTSYLATSP